MKIAELPYRRNSAQLFEAIAREPWSIFLDSGYPYIDSGRFDIIAARPYKTIITRGNETLVDNGREVRISQGDPFDLVRSALGERAQNYSGLPFCGGALGYFGYDLCRRLEHFPARDKPETGVPDMAVGLYDWAVIVDHHVRRTWMIGQGRDPATEKQWEALQKLFSGKEQPRLSHYTTSSPMRCSFDKAGYATALGRIKEYIRDGDCYQVNLTQEFTFDVEGDPWDIYLAVRQSNPAPFASFFRTPDAAVLSTSPERFLSLNNGQVETKPIKGTIRRSVFAYEDKALAGQLLESEKDRAENLMIVDLLRNDIGMNCEIGSVAVPKLFALETYATVHHLVSTVTGRLAHGRHAMDLLRDCFPGGSITGAPKLRAIQIIEELEPHRRSVYCGAIGYVGFDGNMDTNIAIRTLVHHGGEIRCWAGGGIVADSDMESEYRECFSKIEALLKQFERKQKTSHIA
jgi:para-aminobenzoate synthetase component 1